MLLHFSKHHRLSIQSSCMRIKSQILLLISIFAAVEVPVSIASTAAENSSLYYSSSSSYRHFSFSLFLNWFRYFLSVTISLLFFVFFVAFFHLSHAGTEFTVIYILHRPPRRSWIIWSWLGAVIGLNTKPKVFQSN